MTQWTPQPERRTGNLWIGMMLGVIVGLMLIGLVWALTVGQPGTTATPRPAETATVDPVATPTPPAVLPTPTPFGTPTPSGTPTPTPSPTPTALPEGVVTELPAGTYLTVLESLRKSAASAEQALARAEGLGNEEFPAAVLDSDEVPGLKPGFWVIAIPGASDGSEAKDRCAKVGEAFGTDCYVRQVGA